MAPPKGHKRWGGRAKGQPNRQTLTMMAQAEALGVDPFQILLLTAKGDYKTLGVPATDMVLKIRVDAASECCQYLYPKRKAIELSGPDGGAIELANLSNVELINRVKDLLDEPIGDDTDSN